MAMPETVTAEAGAPQAAHGGPQAPRRPPRPNYHRIHALPMPLAVYPLPALVLHNPLSILSFALTYFLQSFQSWSSHPKRRPWGYLSVETRSVHVTDPEIIRELWERGFFGKGSLSRSEPTWLTKEKRRRGLTAHETSEELTAKRRQDRREFKNERARKEREAIEQKLQEERTLHSVSASATTEPAITQPLTRVDASKESTAEGDPCLRTNAVPDGPTRNIALDAQIALDARTTVDHEHPDATEQPLRDQEHLQLTLEETFFLAYGLGVLDVVDPESHQICSSQVLLSIFRQHSFFPPRPISRLAPDDPFLISYVVYHHFRSLGWVVRPGIKFAVDYLLYHRGPVFAHAEFAVVIIPSYDDPFYAAAASSPGAGRIATRGRDWWWLHCVNRVQAQVHKTVLLVYVEVPPPTEQDGAITCLLNRYKIRELILKRWTPNRGRD